MIVTEENIKQKIYDTIIVEAHDKLIKIVIDIDYDITYYQAKKIEYIYFLILKKEEDIIKLSTKKLKYYLFSITNYKSLDLIETTLEDLLNEIHIHISNKREYNNDLQLIKIVAKKKEEKR